MLNWVKEQTQVLGRDLTEFANVVTTDAKEVVGGQGKSKEKSAPETLLREDVNTYTGGLEDEAAAVEAWLAKTGFSLESYAERIEEVLETIPSVATYHAELTPSRVTPRDFWLRYFFKLDKHHTQQGRKALLETIDTAKCDPDDDPLTDSWDCNSATPGDLAKKLAESRAENRALKKQIAALEARLASYEKEKDRGSKGEAGDREEEGDAKQGTDAATAGSNTDTPVKEDEKGSTDSTNPGEWEALTDWKD